MEIDRPTLFGCALAALEDARSLAEHWRTSMWSHVHERELAAGKTPQEATMATQGLMRHFDREAPAATADAHRRDPGWLRDQWKRSL